MAYRLGPIPRDKGKVRPFHYRRVGRAPKRINPSDPFPELEPLMYNTVPRMDFAKAPPPGRPDLWPTDPIPQPIPHPHGRVEAPGLRLTPRLVKPFADEMGMWNPIGGYDETGESDEHHATHTVDQDAFYYDEHSLKLRSKHGESSQVVPVGDIPEDLTFRELATGEEYNKAFDRITARYDGVDGLTEDEATHPDRRGWVITKRSNAIISFDSEATAATETTRATHGPSFGQILKPDREGSYKPWIKLEFVMNSQHPAIALVLQEKGQDDVTCYFYANSIQRDLEGDEVKFQIRGNKEAGGRHKHIEEVAELRESGDLVQVHVLPCGPIDVITNDIGVSTEPAVFTGISSARVDELVEFADGNHPTEWEAMSDREKVIALLHRSQNFSVFRFWPSGGTAPVDSLREWMDTAMWATAKYGFHWFYQMQSDRWVGANDFPWVDVTVPRWLARTVSIEFDREGELVTMRPYEWNQLMVGEKFLLPMQAAGALPRSLPASYVGERQSMTIEKASCPRDFRQKGTFKADPEHKGIFTVAIWPGEWRMWTTDPSLRPTPGARIVIEVSTPKFEYDGKTHKMRGEILQDTFGTKAKINAIVRGPARLLEISHRYGRRPAGWTKYDFRVYLRQEEDPTPAGCHVATVERIGEGRERAGGIDIPALAPDALPAELIPEHLMKKAKKNSERAQSGKQKKQKCFRDPRDRGRRGGREYDDDDADGGSTAQT